jgi:hypothetical protein
LRGRPEEKRSEETATIDPARRAKLQRELEQEFVPDYDALNMPAADKRAAYALEQIAFRIARIEQNLARIAAAIESALAKTYSAIPFAGGALARVLSNGL